MMPTTLDVVRAAFRADPTIGVSERARLLALLRAGGEVEKPGAAPVASEPRILRRSETARRLAASLRSVDNWSRDGILQKVRLPGRVRAVGFRESDVVALIEGRKAEGGPP